MCKSLVTITAALAIVSLGSLVSDHAQAGASSSAPSKYGYYILAAQRQALAQPRVQATKSDITSFSSSSAKSLPRR
jgi:hypothetical protein